MSGRAMQAARRAMGLASAALLSALAGLVCGCEPWQIALSASGAAVNSTVLGSSSPGQEIEQVYYLGAFDPQEQVPATVYRVTVHGQASTISAIKFASGWAPAGLVDSLNTHMGFDMSDPNQPGLKISEDGKHLTSLKTGRRMVLFGPEGFREAPKDHRLVIVMGTSPHAFFAAIDEALSGLASLYDARSTAAIREELLRALSDLRREEQRLGDLAMDLEVELSQPVASTEKDKGNGR